MSLTIIKPAYPEADPRIITYAEQAGSPFAKRYGAFVKFSWTTWRGKGRQDSPTVSTVKKRPGRSGSRRSSSGPPGITTAWS